MIVNGIDTSGLFEKQPAKYPETVDGRVALIDADFLAYIASAVKDGETKSITEMKLQADSIIEHLRRLAGATSYELHITPSNSNKGNRCKIALLKPYQGNRDGKQKPEQLNTIRQWLHDERGAVFHTDIEADDAIAIKQYAAVAAGNSDKSIIVSKDKDLRMITGLHLNWDTGEIVETDEYGYIELDDSKSTKILKGYGWKFFFAQMLMGDSADNISGLPLVSKRYLNKWKPTLAVKKALAVLDDPESTDKKIQRARDTLYKRKPAKCGATMAYELLKDIDNTRDAFRLTRDLYRIISEDDPEVFKNYRDGEIVPWGLAFISEAKLLWMRRKKDENDFIDWIVKHAT